MFMTCKNKYFMMMEVRKWLPLKLWKKMPGKGTKGNSLGSGKVIYF